MAPLQCDKQFREFKVGAQVSLRPLAPIVEIAGNDEGFIVRNVCIDSLGQCFELLSSLLLKQPKVYAQCVQANVAPGRLNDAVQNAAA